MKANMNEIGMYGECVLASEGRRNRNTYAVTHSIANFFSSHFLSTASTMLWTNVLKMTKQYYRMCTTKLRTRVLKMKCFGRAVDRPLLAIATMALPMAGW